MRTKRDATATPAQRRVMDFIRQYSTYYGYAPTIRDICEGLGYASTNGAVHVLKQLEARGALMRTPGSARTLRVVEGVLA